MSLPHRSFLSLLLVVLVATWGTCPCLFAKMLRRVQGETTTAVVCVVESQSQGQTAPSCCCRKVAPTSGPSEAPVPDTDDCPCCEHGAWMRDLPPQVHAVALDAPGVSPFDVALSELPCLAQHAIEAHVPTDPMGPASGPPTTDRPHAAPVGVVILLL